MLKTIEKASIVFTGLDGWPLVRREATKRHGVDDVAIQVGDFVILYPDCAETIKAKGALTA